MCADIVVYIQLGTAQHATVEPVWDRRPVNGTSGAVRYRYSCTCGSTERRTLHSITNQHVAALLTLLLLLVLLACRYAQRC